tara:strand:+ start:3333 stop:3707 length:375 start_codon:yes stop_codon:yes gene_type:complete
MGRYYNGDINGKFWFAVQDSNCADRFGKNGYYNEFDETDLIRYSFEKEDLKGVTDELKSIRKNMGDKYKVVKKFFEANNGYNHTMLGECGLTTHDISEYADLLIGRQIRDSIKSMGGCYFEGEN